MPETLIQWVGGPKDGYSWSYSAGLPCWEQKGVRRPDGQILWETYYRFGDKMVFLGWLEYGQPAIDQAVSRHTGQPVPPPPPPKTCQDSPALRHRSEHYPAAWVHRVPRRVRMLATVGPDFPLCVLPDHQGMVATLGEEYPVWVNSHGAVAAILPDGRHLGLRPAEFEVIEWHQPEEARKP